MEASRREAAARAHAREGHDRAERGPVRLGDGGAPAPGADRLAYTRFEEVARAHPDLTAVVDRHERVSYGELDSRANRLARRLREEHGVGPEQVVGICLPRRLDVIAGLLAIHKAGGAYLPLDPAYPAERRRFMLRDSGATAVLTESSLEPELRDGPARVLDADAIALEDDGGLAPAPDWDRPAAGDLAYLMYTSGSTGRPKGVMIEQSNLAAFVAWGVSAFSGEELSSVLASTSLSFDISVFEVFVPLAVGGRVVLVDNLFGLAAAGTEEVGLVNTVPSLMAAFLNDHALPESVATVCLAGEPLSAELAEAVHSQPGVTRVVNAYGPTEDTIYSTASDVPRGSRPTIGHPLPGTRAYVLDDADRPLAPGEEGELWLGGAGVARGYHRREELTAERFVTKRIGDGRPERLYRTGDLARFEPDGSLQHLGRLDHQIKVRGVRIEPGEIESAITLHDGVRHSVVLARPDHTGASQLVAWVQPAGGSAPSGRDLRDHLRRILPHTMIPSSFVAVDEMPLTPNGKLDRDRLPDPPALRPSTPPATDTERALAELWVEVLGLDEPPGRDDDFFDLGGQSLLALRLLDLIAGRFDRDLPPSTLVEGGTLRLLAERIEAPRSAEPNLVVLNADGAAEPYFYIFAGSGGAFTLRHLSAALGADRPAFGIEVYPPAPERRDERSVIEVADECLSLIRRIQPSGPYLLSGHSIGGLLAFEIACRLTDAGERVDLLAMLDPAAPQTLRLTGRLVARGSELIGTGPEGRRRGLLGAVARRVMRSQYEDVGLPGFVADENAAEWMRSLRERERAYHPPCYDGGAVVFTTEDTARYTGSSTLGWHRYIGGELEAVRVPGDHVSMLVDPNVRALARGIASRVPSPVAAAA